MRVLHIFVFFLMLLPMVVAHGQTLTNPSEDDGIMTVPSERGDGAPLRDTAQLKNPLDGRISTIPDFFGAIIDVLLVFAIPFVVFFIIWAGFLYVTARGNAEKIRQAHNALLYALIGGLLILGANLLLDIITNTVDQVADRP